MKNKIDEVRNLKQLDPFLRPDWRHERVLQLLDQPEENRTTRWDDRWIKGGRDFFHLWRRWDAAKRQKLLGRNPGLYYAYKVFQHLGTDPNVPWMIEARLLAGQPMEEIARALRTCPETVQWYEALFFNVSDALDAHDWLYNTVLQPAMDRFAQMALPAKDDDTPMFKQAATIRPFLDYTAKYFALFGGPVLCDFIISGFRRGWPLRSLEDLPSWLDEQWSLTIRRRSLQAAMVFDVNKFNAVDLFATHARIIELQRNAESSDERRTLLEKHVHTMLQELPWVSGDAAREVFADTELGQWDNSSRELRDEELLLLGAGEKSFLSQLQSHTSIFDKRKSKENHRDGNA